nr:hypothetical protein [Tanacetum cinerariifolium]
LIGSSLYVSVSAKTGNDVDLIPSIFLSNTSSLSRLNQNYAHSRAVNNLIAPKPNLNLESTYENLEVVLRRRGHPPKSPMTVNISSQIADVESSHTVTEKPRKPSGRPRKLPQPNVTIASIPPAASKQCPIIFSKTIKVTDIIKRTKSK